MLKTLKINVVDPPLRIFSRMHSATWPIRGLFSLDELIDNRFRMRDCCSVLWVSFASSRMVEDAEEPFDM